MRMLALVTLLLSLSSLAHSADWDIDPTFGSNGLVALPFDAAAPNTDRIVKILRYPDNLAGKYVTVGSASMPGGIIGIALARFNADGMLDTTFGTNGRVLKEACMSEVNNAAFDSLFRIVVVGTTTCSGNATTDGAVVRFTAQGAVDTTFAGDGGLVFKYKPSFDGNDHGGAVLVLSDDSLLVGGDAGGNQAFVQRISVTGVASTLPAAQTFSSAMPRKIVDVALGQANSSFWLYNEVGQSSNTPGGIWKINNATLGNDLGFDSLNGEKPLVVQAGSSCGTGPEHRASSLVRFGTRIYAFGFTNSAVGRSFVVGVGENDGTVRTYRCLEQGSTPVNFTALAAVSSSDAGGSVYLAGSRGAPENFALWRVVKADLSALTFIPDTTFNGGVPVSVSFTAASGQMAQSDAFSMVRHGNKTVLAGLRVWNLASGDFDFALARFGLDNSIIFQDGFEN